VYNQTFTVYGIFSDAIKNWSEDVHKIMSCSDRNTTLKERLDTLYHIYNNKKYVQYDPLRYLYFFEDDVEKELMGLVASSFAFGRVTQIFKAIDRLLRIMGNSPLKYVMALGSAPDPALLSFRYRFVSGLDVYRFLRITRQLIEDYGSIGCFMKRNYNKGDFLRLVDLTMRQYADVRFLVPVSLKTSACKRLFMYFRWMVREDNIDTGLWNFIDPAELVIPLDTHIFQSAIRLGLTSKKNPSFAVAREITERLKGFCRNDPVRYDWAISHEGIIKNNFATHMAMSERSACPVSC